MAGATIFNSQQWHDCQNAENTLFLFTEEEAFWLPMTHRSNCWGWQSSYFQIMLDRQHETKGHGKCCKHSETSVLNWHINTNLHFTCFMNVLTRNRSNDNPFLACNRSFQHFQWPLSVSGSMTPVHPKASAPKGKFEIVAICMGEPKQTFDFLHMVFSPELSIQSETFLVPDVNHTVVIFVSHLASFPRTRV